TLDRTYMGRRMVTALQAGCEDWPRGTLPDDFKQPVSSDRPALLLSGSADPVTPPSHAVRAQKNLSNARHIVVPDHGHGMARLRCVSRMITKFIETADITTPDEKCLADQPPAPFFTSPTGAAP
ncbi:MAG: alpha/beta hydrolase, partial [Myxococcota bacterium]